MTDLMKLIKRALQKTSHVLLAFSLLSALLLYPPLALHAEESFSVTDMSSSATVGDSTLNVRSGPGKEYDAIGRVSPGDTLTVTGETDNNWYRIDFSGKEGYVFSDYVTLGGASSEDAVHPNDPNDFANYEEGAPQTDSILTTSPKMLILLGVIIVIVAIMIGTIIMIKKSDEDEYDEYDDDDMYYEDDDVEDDEEEEYDDEDDDTDDESFEDENAYYEEPVRRKKQVTSKTPAKHPAAKPVRKAATPVASTPAPKQAPVKKMITEEDYTLQIDPRIFDDEKTVTASAMDAPVTPDSVPKEKDEFSKKRLEELQKEIERLKNERES